MSINTFRFLNHLSNFIQCKQHAIQVEHVEEGGGGGEKNKREYKTPQYKSDLFKILTEEKYIVVLQ